ncbi:MAG TPA: VCBS repeat-containing protein, partial [Deltaproteobacteria bacterium]|nr:VCBS repeat-containing protein [Deltaproteobacteria bacterium]
MVGDLDGDGWLELWMTEESGLISFTSGPSGLIQSEAPSGDLTLGSGGVTADYDGDGDLDVYLARWVGWPGPEEPGYGANRLLRNDGDGTFTDVTELA